MTYDVAETKCWDCDSRKLDRNTETGDLFCVDCGVEQKESADPYDSSPAPIREGDDNRSGGPIRREVSVQKFDTTPRDGDVVLNLPPAKKREGKSKKQARKEIEKIGKLINEIKRKISVIDSKIKTEQKEQSEGFEDRVAELKGRHRVRTQEMRELERDSEPWFEIFKSKSRAPTKDSEWIYKHHAKDFLRLGRHQDENDLSEDIKDLNINRQWIEMVVDAISNPGLPDRSPEGEE